MKGKKLYYVLGLVLVMLLVAFSPTSSQGDKIYAEAVEVFCTYEIGLWWVDGDMYYERGSRQTGFKIPLTKDDPFPTGLYDIEVDLDLNLAKGKGSGEGGAMFFPEGSSSFFGGTWKSPMVEVEPEVWLAVNGKGRSVGVFELEGWRVKSKSYPIDPTPYAGVCEGGANPTGVLMLQLWYYPPD